MPFMCRSSLSSRFRFAERPREGFAESECEGGLSTPLIEAITKLTTFLATEGAKFRSRFVATRDEGKRGVTRFNFDLQMPFH